MNVLPILRVLLWPFSLLYGAAMKLRTKLYTSGWMRQERLKGIVISVGNITVGGTGKTPMVIWLAEKFLAQGKRVAILSRGYRGAQGTSDEIEVMKARLQNRVFFGVGRDRVAEGRRLEANGVDIFLLDDAFQHLELARDVDIVMVDSTRPLHAESIVPAGRLREPLSAIHRATFVVFTRTEQSDFGANVMRNVSRLETYLSTTKLLGFLRHDSGGPSSALLEVVPGPVFAFCGIGNPDAFFRNLERWGMTVVGRKAYRDHHHYTKSDVQGLERAARLAGAKALITTEKDWQNLSTVPLAEMAMYTAVIALDIPDESRFFVALQDRIRVARGVAA
jgi:tetraacyldisaccharide 4'-kinase